MKCKFSMVMVAVWIVLLAFAAAHATMEMTLKETLRLEERPLDVGVSLSGKWIYVLTERREILLYSIKGELVGRVSVPESVDGIRMGPREDILFLTSREGKTVQIATVDLIREIDESGAPFRGSPDAPVVLAVFSEFQ